MAATAIERLFQRSQQGLAAALALCGTLASAQSLHECAAAPEGTPFSVQSAKSPAAVSGVVLGQGSRAVVFSNTAYNAPCEWLPTARELVARGYQVVLWKYEGGGLEQIADLQAVMAEARRRGAQRVALVGGSRGGCLSMMTASEMAEPPAGVAILSCAAVFNRRSPTATAPYAARLKTPLLHLTGEHDGIPTLDEAREEFKLYPSADKQLVVVPGVAAHGDQLLTDPRAAPIAKPALLEFLVRVLGS